MHPNPTVSTALTASANTASTHTPTCVNDLRMKKRFGKYCIKILELVLAYEPELLEWGAGRPRCLRPLSSSLPRLRLASSGAASLGELLGVVSASDDVGERGSWPARAASRAFSFWSRIHRTCRPAPRCPPTPALTSSSRARTRHTRRGHRGSPGRSGCPLKWRIAARRCVSLWKLTNAQFEREMRKMDSTPPHTASTPAAAEDGPAAVPADGSWLRKRQSSSCVVSEGTFPTHITHSERCAGGCGWCGRRERSAAGRVPEGVVTPASGCFCCWRVRADEPGDGARENCGGGNCDAGGGRGGGSGTACVGICAGGYWAGGWRGDMAKTGEDMEDGPGCGYGSTSRGDMEYPMEYGAPWW